MHHCQDFLKKTAMIAMLAWFIYSTLDAIFYLFEVLVLANEKPCGSPLNELSQSTFFLL